VDRSVQIRILLDPAKLAARNLSPAGLVPDAAAGQSPVSQPAVLTTNNQEVHCRNRCLPRTTPEDVGNVVVGVFGGKPVYLREVADY